MMTLSSVLQRYASVVAADAGSDDQIESTVALPPFNVERFSSDLAAVRKMNRTVFWTLSAIGIAAIAGAFALAAFSPGNVTAPEVGNVAYPTFGIGACGFFGMLVRMHRRQVQTDMLLALAESMHPEAVRRIVDVFVTAK